jgi:hypothetical protein
MADMWKCHLCGDTYLIATTPACFKDGHARCSLCPVVMRTRSGSEQGSRSETIEGTSEQHKSNTTQGSFLPEAAQDIDEDNTLHISISIEGHSFETPLQDNASVPLHDLLRPSMEG